MSQKPDMLRQSQLITAFGPGAMVDLPDRSVLVGGLDIWRLPNPPKTIHEPALVQRLTQLLRERAQLPEGRSIRLLEPPVATDFSAGDAGYVDVLVFPSWFVSNRVETPVIGGRERRARRIVQWRDLDERTRTQFRDEANEKHGVSPIRFVGACPNGHLQDLDWRGLLHRGAPCEEPMWLCEEGTSASLDDLIVACGCGRTMAMREATQPGRLDRCQGRRPWLVDASPEPCDQRIHLLTRTATNAYFPQVATIISLPEAEDELTVRVLRNMHNLESAENAEMVRIFRLGNRDLDRDLAGFDNEEIFARLTRLKQEAKAAGGEETASPTAFKSREFDVFASGAAVIGDPGPRSRLYAETLGPTAWRRTDDPRLDVVSSVVAIHRLREVMCLYGFTRLEPAPAANDDFEDIQLAVSGAALADEPDWLPAVEQFGEGIFLTFKPSTIDAWLMREKVVKRINTLAAGWKAHKRKYPNSAGKNFPGGPYVLLHSLAHSLITEIALECGYPASALRERVYALSPQDGTPGRYGVLVYTASAGAEGTLGGLVATTERLSSVFVRCLDSLALCSNDPVCADHLPDTAQDERSLLGAACHGCLLIAETSCEARNNFLDRALLVETVAGGEANLL